ncbi:MAG: type II toxin-antitoxin system VapC family toxin, partial [Solirubrobacterales bacterium]|nr:type II toxin-antitoxin system VapC family toxin [Solirubrobacterales bacterium]
EEEHTEWLLDLMDRDPVWTGSTLLAAEVPIAVAKSLEPTGRVSEADAVLARDLDAFQLVPIDADCIVRAVEIGRDFRVRTLDAIHLAALRILPSECQFVTFDDRQRDAAEAMGLNALTPPV